MRSAPLQNYERVLALEAFHSRLPYGGSERTLNAQEAHRAETVSEITEESEAFPFKACIDEDPRNFPRSETHFVEKKTSIDSQQKKEYISKENMAWTPTAFLVSKWNRSK